MKKEMLIFFIHAFIKTQTSLSLPYLRLSLCELHFQLR